MGGASMMALGGVSLPVSSDAPIETSSKHRVIIWSHGLATWGSHYSLMATFLSSMPDRPTVVVAINHTDGSATASEDYGNGGNEILYEVVGKGNPEEEAVRERQLKMRVKNVADAWSSIKAMNDEDGPWKGRLDVAGGFVVAGHSFGGGTAVATGIDHDDCVGAIAFDPWCFPAVNAGYLKAGVDCKVPVLAVTCDRGPLSSPDYWRRNCALLEMLPEKTTDIMRFCGSDHIDISDASLMLPHPLRSVTPETYFLEHRRYIRSFMEGIGWRAGVRVEEVKIEDAKENEEQGEKEWVQHNAPY